MCPFATIIEPIHKNATLSQKTHTPQKHSPILSITAAIRRSIPPPLVRLRTIKLGLPQPLIHLVVPLAQPPAERAAPADVRRVRLHLRAEVRRAVRARVQHGQRVQQREHVQRQRLPAVLRLEHVPDDAARDLKLFVNRIKNKEKRTHGERRGAAEAHEEAEDEELRHVLREAAA
ncbi:hypothetical protein EWM64_g8684 [Hericium alpestre]|uniref:Uncharacterized protein n=1 Tax=Hericium alpestre TaxID=135208 RepID=A0A4Y9ZP85_9AGAM|nr:hypothetical protein EWM64_g8684 [Hericium alpestre]